MWTVSILWTCMLSGRRDMGEKKEDAFPFDPGIFVDDDGKVYLYSGFYTPVPSIVTGFRKLKFEGGYMVELQEDMKTIKKLQ